MPGSSRTRSGAGESAPTPDDPELLADLARLGFSDYEARLYLALFEHAPTTAYELSKRTGLHRANAYNALEALRRKGHVQQVSETPARFVAIDPGTLLARIREETASLCERLDERLRARNQVASHYIWVFDGEQEVERRIRDMIARAGTSILLKGRGGFVRPYLDDLRAAAGRGVRIVAVVFADSTADYDMGAGATVLLHEGNGVLVGGAIKYLTLTTDETCALTVSIEPDMAAAYSENRAFTHIIDVMIRREAYLAEIMGALGEAVEDRFGPGLIELRRAYSPRFGTLGAAYESYVERRLEERGIDAGRAPRKDRAP